MKIQKTSSARSKGFTLIELLLVIAIIAVFSGMALVAVRGAQDEANRSATLTRMNQIRTFLLDRLEDYEIRRLPISLAYDNLANHGYTGDDLLPAERRQIGQRIIADMILLEMPTPEINMSGSFIPASVEAYPSDAFEGWVSDLEARLNSDGSGRNVNGLGNSIRLALRANVGFTPVAVERVRQFSSPENTKNGLFDQQSEFLHEILRVTDRDGQSGIELLTNRGIGDTDVDGVQEVIDSWGEPFGFQFNFINDDTTPDVFLTLTEAIRDVSNVAPFFELNKIRISLDSAGLGNN